MNLNEQLQQAYEDGRRQALNENLADFGMRHWNWNRFLDYWNNHGSLPRD